MSATRGRACEPHVVLALWMCVSQNLGKTCLWERKRRALRLVPSAVDLPESTAAQAALAPTLEDNSSSLVELRVIKNKSRGGNLGRLLFPQENKRFL